MLMYKYQLADLKKSIGGGGGGGGGEEKAITWGWRLPKSSTGMFVNLGGGTGTLVPHH